MKISRLSQIAVFSIVAVMLTIGVLSAMASEPVPAKPVKSGDAAAAATAQVGRSSASTLKVNEAEMLEKGIPLGSIETATPQLKPMTLEINAVLETARLNVADLQERFDNTLNESMALDIASQIEALKVNAELDVLRVQLKYASENGRDDLVQKLEADLTKMTTPRPRREPINRPASDAGNR